MKQLICHLIGDYLLQSDWMAQRKGASWLIACIHAVCYGIPFCLCFKMSMQAYLFIVITHAIIDHLKVARFLCYLKNFLAPPCTKFSELHVVFWHIPWKNTNFTGYDSAKPEHITFWLFVIADNTLHLACNYYALGHL